MIKADDISIRKRIALSLYSIKKQIETQLHELNYLFWECTTSCNLYCLHCGSDCTRSSITPDMPIDDFISVLRGIKSRMNPSKILIAITGGEPLMRDDLEKAGEQIHSLGYPWGIVTNGLIMTKKRFEGLLRSGMCSIAVSLDGLEEHHDWFRGKKGSYKQAFDTIRMASAAFRKGLFFDVVTCVHQRNLAELHAIKSLLVDAGVPRWRLVSIFPKGRAQTSEELKLSGDQLRELLEFIKTTRREGRIIASYGCEGFLGDYELEVRDIPFFCRAGTGIGSVLVDGSISACPSLRQDFIQGNIYNDDFLDIWNNRFEVMRNRNWARTGECSHCSVWNYCKGNGLHLRDQRSGKLLFCQYRALVDAQGNG